MRNFKNTEFGGFGKCENQDFYVFLEEDEDLKFGM
jgi:hypothetical protein